MAWERVVNRKGILRLSYENQWEAHIYRVDGREIKKLRKVRIDDVTYKVTTFSDTRHYSDMGHPGSATTDQYSIDVPIHGKKLPITLDKLLAKKIRVTAVEFELNDART